MERYNGYCDAGLDEEYAGDPEKLLPIRTAPYYAMVGVASMLNTMGGPKRDIEGGIVDVEGNVIPHLYSAGELGCVYGYMYNGGGNVGEALSSGRIAVRNAAQLDSWE